MSLAIETSALCRRFAGGQGVDRIDLRVPPGAVYGFLGPNGAGKTTTIRLLLGLLRPDSGSARLFGHDIARERAAALAQVGALVESPALYRHLSGRDNLEITRRLIDAPRARIDEVLERVDLLADGRRRVADYSLGMRQRIAIALALLGRPRLLVLDEPSNGLDPAGILDMRRLLTGLAADEGISVFVSSHLLSEIELIASHVGVLHCGQLRFQGTLAQLRSRCTPRLLIGCETPLRAHEVLRRAGEQVDWATPQTLAVTPSTRTAVEINRLLLAEDIGVSHLAAEPTSLESLFFDLTAPIAQEVAA